MLHCVCVFGNYHLTWGVVDSLFVEATTSNNVFLCSCHAVIKHDSGNMQDGTDVKYRHLFCG